MGTLVFLSRAEPYRRGQREFLLLLRRHLAERGFDPRTVGETDFDMSGMSAIRGLLMQSHGLLSVAFRRMVVHDGEDRPDPDPDIELRSSQRVPMQSPTWLTTPWCHMETAMAYQMGLPILLLVEDGVRLEGVLEGGVLGQYPPTFDVQRKARTLDDFFENTEKWHQLSATWEGHVREVLRHRTSPHPLFGSSHG